MLRYASIFLLVAIAAIAIILLGKLLVGGAVFIAQVSLGVCILLFLAFFTLDKLRQRKKRKNNHK